MAHAFEFPKVQDIVTLDAPALVLPAPITSLPSPKAPVCLFHRSVWPAPAVAELTSAWTASVSMTSSPVALETVTEAVELSWFADAKAPWGVLWLTPVKETAPATIRSGDATLTTMLAVPDAGAILCHISIRSLSPFHALTKVSAAPP